MTMNLSIQKKKSMLNNGGVSDTYNKYTTRKLMSLKFIGRKKKFI